MNRTPGLLALAALLLAVVLLPAPPADACAPVMGRGEQVRIASESALIVYDEKTKTEHFIRRGNGPVDPQVHLQRGRRK